MECPICFCECQIFKVLQCGHHFCAQCVGDLAQAPSLRRELNGLGAASAVDPKCSAKKPVKKAENSNEGQSDVENGQMGSNCTSRKGEKSDVGTDPPTVTGGEGIPCPQCRVVTTLSYGLKNKFVGDLLCRECDEIKNLAEFRWCQDCASPTCSRCFMDKHLAADSANSSAFMHRGVKWDAGYPQAAYCVSRMKGDVENIEKTMAKNRAYVKDYLVGLQEYVDYEMEKKMHSLIKPKAQQMLAICQAYQLDENCETAAVELKNLHKSYDTLLSEVLKLASIDRAANTDEVSSEDCLKLKCPSYKEMAQLFLRDNPPAPTPSDPPAVVAAPRPIAQHSSIGASFKGRSGATRVVEWKEVKNPSELFYFEPLGLILVTDFESGLKILDPTTLRCEKIWSKKEALRYSQICAVPPSFGEPNNVDLAVRVLIGDKCWSVAFLKLRRKTGSTQVTVEDDFGIIGPPPTIKYSQRMVGSHEGLYFQTSRGIYHHYAGQFAPGVFSVVYETPSEAEQLGIMGPIFGGDGEEICIFVVDDIWNSVDLMFYNEKLCKLAGVKRIEMGDVRLTKSSFLVLFDPNVVSLLLADNNASKLSVWNVGREGLSLASSFAGFPAENGELLEELQEFKSKFPQKIFCTPKSMWVIFKNNKDKGVRRLEVFDLL